MKETSLIAMLLFSVNAFAQPTINYHTSHSIGSTGLLYLIGGSSSVLQQSGATITWDLTSNALTQLGTFDIVDPTTTPDGVNYPSANTCFKQTLTGQGTTYIYLVDSAHILYSTATGIGGGSPTIWTQYDKLLDYPFNYLDSFSFIREASTGSPEPFTRTYDAYGTLIVNGNTYNNVVRISKNPGNSIWFTTFPVWFPIIIQMSATTYAFNEPTSVTGIIDQNSFKIPMDIYPNPAKELVTITNLPNNSTLRITDVTGKVVYSSAATSEQTTISTADFVNGIYFIRVENDGEVASKKLVVNN